MTQSPDFTRSAELSPLPGDKYDTKMTHEQRCFALSLFLKGESWRIIAAYFRVHYRTVQIIKMGPRYKSVRNELANLGQEAFFEKFYTETEVAAYKKWKEANEETVRPLYQYYDANEPNFRPNQAAKAQAGTHTKDHVFDSSTVHFDIMWREGTGAERPGWYAVYKQFIKGPYGTSTYAYDAAKEWWNPAPIVVETNPDEEAKTAAKLFEDAKAARVAMEIDPSDETVRAFVNAAFAVYRFVDASEGLPEPSTEEMFNRIDWRGFDHTQYPEGWNK